MAPANFQIISQLREDNARLVAALRDILSRATFELKHPTEMRDNAFALIRNTAAGALPPTEENGDV